MAPAWSWSVSSTDRHTSNDEMPQFQVSSTHSRLDILQSFQESILKIERDAESAECRFRNVMSQAKDFISTALTDLQLFRMQQTVQLSRLCTQITTEITRERT
jgi:hypothetical protein